MEFSRQKYWSGLPFPSLGDLSDPEIKPKSPARAGRFFTLTYHGSPFQKIGVGKRKTAHFCTQEVWPRYWEQRKLLPPSQWILDVETKSLLNFQGRISEKTSILAQKFLIPPSVLQTPHLQKKSSTVDNYIWTTPRLACRKEVIKSWKAWLEREEWKKPTKYCFYEYLKTATSCVWERTSQEGK